MKRPEDFTIAEIREYQRIVNQSSTTIQDWKVVIKKLAVKYGLSDREAILLAEVQLPCLDTSPKQY